MSRREAFNVGVFVAASPAADVQAHRAFAERMAADAEPELEAATGRPWTFHMLDPTQLKDDEARLASDLMDEASLRMVEGPYDLVVVVTDVGVGSRDQSLVSGLASEVGHVCVVSTRKLRMAPRGKPTRDLTSDAVRYNAAGLLLHLTGHVLGLRHQRNGPVMQPFAFDEEMDAVPAFGDRARNTLSDRDLSAPDDVFEGGPVEGFLFHVKSALKNPEEAVGTVVGSRAPLLPLALPALSTAALVPVFILVFTAEIWDVGLNMPNTTAWAFAVGALLLSTWYITGVQNLFYPRQERSTLTEHMAVVNSSIVLTMALAMVGLFVMLGLVSLFIELYVFPPGLMQTWPTLGDATVTFQDKLRLAAFMSTVGVLTGALAGGIESRTVVQHLALFREDP